jgi:hypothetical protein
MAGELTAAVAQSLVTADVPHRVMAVDVLLLATVAAIRRRAAMVADPHTEEDRRMAAVRTEAAADMGGNGNLTLDSFPA